MNQAFLGYLHWGGLFFCLLCFALARFNQPRVARIVGIVPLLLALWGVGLIISTAGRVPMYGPLETLSQVLAVVLTMIFFFPPRADQRGAIVYLPWLGAALIQLLLILAPAKLNHNFYMYEHPMVIGFFQFRIWALAFSLLSSLNYLAGIKGLKASHGLSRGRNYLFVAAILYLMGEFSGCTWCLLWLGDYWRWSSGFFESALIFLLMMLIFHFPQSWIANPKVKALAGGLVGPVVMILVMIHQWSAI
ncbi:hypothetical protein [Dethiosulfatarculus sandiegensis]|uniref:Cytochrome c assembly protein domain-containing protein n=1 Tax=Dethiosulfatarculus sandiegensis TaxID=1429043 RepID=A0A0D2GN30_9BACT|nr:hypothetical protein [Dethiosulfatarculus sandiegensis]KIX16012.1 hypothetical protein X474_00145 [Dethiosulfatarculus sandiegensis]